MLNARRLYFVVGILFCLLISSFIYLEAQELGWFWAVSNDGTGSVTSVDIAVDSEGNFYITGYFDGVVTFGNTILQSTGVQDIFAAKMNGSGEWIWAIRAGGTRGRASSTSIGLDSINNIYITGSFEYAVTFRDTELQSEGFGDIFVAKISSTGEWLWAVRAGGSRHNSGSSIAIDGEDNCYVAGLVIGTSTFGNSELQNDRYSAFVAKITNEGDWIWAKSTGGTGRSGVSDIAIDRRGYIFLSGSFNGTVSFDGWQLISSDTRSDLFVAKINSAGEWLMVKQAVSVDGGIVSARGIVLDDEGNIYITGTFQWIVYFGDTRLVSVGTGSFVAKMTSTGDWVWASSTGGVSYCFSYDIALDGEGNTYITGAFLGTVFFGNIELRAISENEDIFIANMDNNGEWQWAESTRGQGSDFGTSIVLDNDGYSYVTGIYGNLIAFNQIVLRGEGDRNLFVAKFGKYLQYPSQAVNPSPDNTEVNVSVDLERLSWSYIKVAYHKNPVGFRVYFNETGEFGDEFDWVVYNENQMEYSYTDIMPENLHYNTTYYWQVIPSASTPEEPEWNDALDSPIWSFRTEKIPHPAVAINPVPNSYIRDVSVELERLTWSHIADELHVNPVGFRVYFNDIEEFGDEFDWVSYLTEQAEYYSHSVLPEELEYRARYYWKVVPTTKANGVGEGFDAEDVLIWNFRTEEDTFIDSYLPEPLTELRQNYPNPFNPETVIEFSITTKGDFTLDILNVKGQLIRTYYIGDTILGRSSILWDGVDNDGKEMPSGIYFYRLSTDSEVITKRMLLLR